MDFVDAHAHHWQVSAHDWYPMLRDHMPGLYRDYLPEHYRTDAGKAGVNVTGLVHVSATTAPRAFLAEARWLDGMDDADRPAALIGTIDPRAPFETIRADLEAQAASPAFRGIRVFDGLDLDSDTATALLRLLGERGWIFDLIAYPAEARTAARAVERAPATTFVLEHAGWPTGDTAADFTAWRDGVTRLAALPNVDCKISGLGMALNTTDPERLCPFVETCLELFGVDRCMFGSNFPVDGVAGTYADLLAAYRETTSSLPEEDCRALFATNATRRYRLS